jgi:hypothetical protein
MQTHQSTGPRTEPGKAISSMNSLKHGLTAKTVVLRGENQADFDRLHQQLLADHAPAGPLETELVAEIAACLWRLQRARRYESTILETSSFELFVSHTQAKGFETLMRYMSAIERQLNRSILRLRETQAERRKQAAVAQPSRVKTMAASSYSPTQFVLSDRSDDAKRGGVPQSHPELATSHQPLATQLTTNHGPLTTELTTDNRQLTTDATAPEGCPQAA